MTAGPVDAAQPQGDGGRAAGASLASELDALRERASSGWSPQERATRARAAAELAATGLADRAVGVGERPPDFVLPGVDGGPVALADLRARGPVVVVFYRGGWCPYCNVELRAWERHMPELTALGAGLLAISPESPDVSAATSAGDGLSFDVLADHDNVVARTFRIVHAVPADTLARLESRGESLASRQGTAHPEIPLPATYVIDPDGVVRFAFVDADYTRRAEPADVLDRLRIL